MESWWRKETSCLVGRTHIYILRGNVEGEDKWATWLSLASGQASPVEMVVRSDNSLNLLVVNLYATMAMSSFLIPDPLFWIWRIFRPPPFTVICVLSALREFSSIFFRAFAGL